MKKNGKAVRWLEEFKVFALRGNVIDLAVGVIIGGAFGKITASLVNDVFMPLIGVILGGIDFTKLSITVAAWNSDKEPISINYGLFISAVVDFIIIAAVVFLMIKIINKLRNLKKESPKEEEESPAEPALTADQQLLTEIRDLLKSGGKSGSSDE